MIRFRFGFAPVARLTPAEIAQRFRAANTQAPAKPTAEVAAQVSQPIREAK